MTSLVVWQPSGPARARTRFGSSAFLIGSRSGGEPHRLSRRESGEITCSCAGYRHRGTCWASAKLRMWLAEDVTVSGELL